MKKGCINISDSFLHFNSLYFFKIFVPRIFDGHIRVLQSLLSLVVSTKMIDLVQKMSYGKKYRNI